jgi:hypothetical protein
MCVLTRRNLIALYANLLRKSQMQVNSAQDYLTSRKRQIIAATYQTIADPPQKRRTNEMYTSVVANSAQQRERFVAPFQGAAGGASGGATYTSRCCLASPALALGIVVDSGVVRFNVIPPMSSTLSSRRIV